MNAAVESESESFERRRPRLELESIDEMSELDKTRKVSNIVDETSQVRGSSYTQDQKMVTISEIIPKKQEHRRELERLMLIEQMHKEKEYMN